jgi:hypothetical protein
MPPQQSHGLLDVFDKRFGFGAHGYKILRRDQPPAQSAGVCLWGYDGVM